MLKILIVDDEHNSTESLAIGVKRYGYYVDTANSGEEGLAKLKNTKFDYVLCDIDMPEMNGWEFASKIYSIYKEIKIIYMTALLRGKIHTKFSKFPLLIKPFKLNELITILKNK